MPQTHVGTSFPDQFGAEGAYKRPASGSIDPSIWTADPKPLQWEDITATVPPPVIGWHYLATWKSPVFDLRPDLRSQTSVLKSGIPMWSRANRMYIQMFGINTVTALNLSVFTQEFGNTNAGDMQRINQTAPGVGATPNANSNSIAALLPSITGVTNVTSVFNLTPASFPGPNPSTPTVGMQPSSVLGFSPFSPALGGGDGYPIRFWYLRLYFFKIIESPVFPLPIPPPISPPDINIQAAMY
jgi:hypothetical protein